MAEECFWTKKDVKFEAAAWVGDLIVVSYLQPRLMTLELHRPRATIGHEDRKDFNGELAVEERAHGLPIQVRQQRCTWMVAEVATNDGGCFRVNFIMSTKQQPDTGLISYGEMLDQGRLITEAVSILVIGDRDNGFGNSMNVKRTFKGFIKTGFAGILLEDQVISQYLLDRN
ncbi:2,3-dimethylmalate lyase [Tanacetum coccineum]